MNVERANDDRGHGIAGNAQCQHGYKGPAHRSVIGRFGRDQPLLGSLAKGYFRVFGAAFGLIIGEQCGDITAGARQSTDQRTKP